MVRNTVNRGLIVRVVTLFLALFLVFSGFIKIFRFKFEDGPFRLDKFYELPPDTVDVLFLGTSHSHCTYNPAILYREYGIAAYSLSGGGQPMWNTYYYLKESLKSQQPQLIVLEGFGLRYNYQYTTDADKIKNNYGLKFSIDKVKAIQASVQEDELVDFLIEPIQYHNRYASLDRTDFLPDRDSKILKYHKGYFFGNSKSEFETPNMDDVTQRFPLSYKTEEYFRLIIELCQEQGIPIVVNIAPYSINPVHQAQYNTAMDIAREYDIPFINYNSSYYYSQIGFDFSQDLLDADHSNFRGSEKVSRYIGQYIVDTYHIPDRREDNQGIWESWDKNAEIYYQAAKNSHLKEIVEWDAYYEFVSKDPSYVAFITTTGDCSGYYKESIEILENLGVYPITYDLQGTWVIGFDGVVSAYTQDTDSALYLRLGKYTFDFSQPGAIFANQRNYAEQEDCINICIYDTITDSIIDSIYLDKSGLSRFKP